MPHYVFKITKIKKRFTSLFFFNHKARINAKLFKKRGRITPYNLRRIII